IAMTVSLAQLQQAAKHLTELSEVEYSFAALENDYYGFGFLYDGYFRQLARLPADDLLDFIETMRLGFIHCLKVKEQQVVARALVVVSQAAIDSGSGLAPNILPC